MALIDKASLLMVPSTYEAGKLYNVLPSGNRAPDSTDQNSGYDQTRADFDFDRGSNAAATRIGSDGLLKKYRENLLTESNNFSDSDWVKADTSVTSGQADKDGGTNAWLLAITAAAGFQTLRQTKSVSGVNTISIYAKANALNWMRIINGVSSTYFDISNGVVGTDSSIGASIESAGNGFFRCSVPFSGAGSYVYIYPATGNGNVSQSSGSIYIQSAQVESGMVSTDYLNSTDVTAKAGVLIDQPRINYDANGENGALLLEPSRANLFPHSEYFGDWTTFRSSVSENEATSPEGLINAYKLIQESGQTTSGGLFKGVTTIDATSYTYTFFAKEAGYGWCYARLMGGANNYYAWFDLSNGVKGNVTNGATSSIEPYGNGWYRCSITFANLGTSAIPHIYIAESNSSASVSNPDGVKGINIYGAMIEAGSYASSYIPNHGTSGGVTRAADSCSVTGASDVIGQTEGTVFAEFDSSQFLNGSYISISDGTTANRQIFGWEAQSGDSGTLRLYGFWNGFAYSSFSRGQKIKVALAYKNNDFALYVNGTQAGTKTSATISGTLSQFAFNSGASSQEYQGNIYQTALFKERLTNAELATLTTL